MQALVLDLRNNPGGLLNSRGRCLRAIFAAEHEGRFHPGARRFAAARLLRPRADEERPRFPLVVLVNEGSASGSEIVAGALKDLRRAILVGETTFGKGSVQNVVQLPDGSALRFTTAKYYTPSKQVIHGNGVVPNIRVAMTAEQERALFALRNREHEAGGEKNLIKTKDPQTVARDRRAQRRDGLCAGKLAEGRTGQEIIVVDSERSRGIPPNCHSISQRDGSDFARHDSAGIRNLL